jgi:hypothetical protein
MNYFIKFLKIASILVLMVLMLLFFTSLVIQNKVAGIVLNSLNRNISTKIDAESYRLSLLKRFPRATVTLKNPVVFSSPDFNHSAFAGINADTLLIAKSAFIDFKLIDLLKGEYTFTSMTIKSGKILLLTDKEGRDNYDVSRKDDMTRNGSGASLNLNRINLTDMKAVYNDRYADLTIGILIENGRIKSRITGNNIDFESNSDIRIEYFQLGKFSMRMNIPANLETGLNRNEKGVFFRNSTLGIKSWNFILTGYITSDNYIDLTVSGKNVDIAEITRLLPDRYRTIAMDYHPSGILKLESTIKGKASRKENPHYEISWSLKDAYINHRKSDLKVDRFSFDGSYSNGAGNKAETSTLKINNFTTRLGGAEYRGSFSISDFTRPVAALSFNGILYPSELKEFLNLKHLDYTRGSVNLDLKFAGRLVKKGNYGFSDMPDMNSTSVITFNSFGVKLNNRPVDLKDVNGSIVFSGKKANTSNLGFNLNGERITLDGSFDNLAAWIVGQPVNLIGTVAVKASSIKPGTFIKSSPSPKEMTGINGGKASVNFPGNVILSADFNIDTLIYKTFIAEKVSGLMKYKPKVLEISELALNSQKGKIQGSGMVYQNSDKSVIGKGNFTFSGLDVNEAFVTFHNFGQNFLKAENIRGSLSGSLSVLLPTDSLLKPDVKAVTAEGKYQLTDGALIDFDPVKHLSSFIELSELENIKFDKLENDFFIRSNSLYIPQMDVKSSAVDLSVNGRHTFDNNYEYHIKLLLSAILSKKARTNKSRASEFGEIADDGLGRTSLLLKMVGKGEDVKVSYDMQAAEMQIRDDIRKERQTLKDILNKEYGRSGYDPGKDPEKTSRPRFRITWEGSDSTATENNQQDVEKESIFKKLFKKK